MKCLVTKLKASTGNESLSKYNTLTLKCSINDNPTLSTQWFKVSANENGSVLVDSTSVGIYKGSELEGDLMQYPITVNSGSTFEKYIETMKEGIIEISNKYNLKGITFGPSISVRFREIYGLKNITALYITSCEDEYVDVSKVINTLNKELTTTFQLGNSSSTIYRKKLINKPPHSLIADFKLIKIWASYVIGLFEDASLDDLKNNTNAVLIESAGFKRAGNMSSLQNLTNLTTITFNDAIQNKGDIMDFITPWIEKGRTSGKINVKWLLSQRSVTLNGSAITYPSDVSNSNAYLNWTSNGTVTFTAS